MPRFLLFLTLLLRSAVGLSAPPTPLFPQPLSPRIANYQIDVALNPETKRLTGRQTLTWRNASPDRITELQFHLYLNAFKDGNSTFMRESGGQLRGVQMDKGDKNGAGWTNLTSIKRRNVGTTPEPLAYQFIQPDDGNKDDRTVIRVPLTRPLAPGETIVLDMTFEAKLPKIFARTGFSRDYFLVGQWFPKIGVWEAAGTRYAKTGQWNCHQFHAHSEFYADYGTYDVNITTPKEYWVGGTGVMQAETQHSNGTKTLRWRAEDVVDFAWTASPHFQVADQQWKHVKIRALMQPEHFSQADRHFHAAKAALAYFEKTLGRYPYSTLTIVDPPLHGMGSFGMEYPTFITAGTFWGAPKGVRVAEMVVVHEFGHQYFMQLLASNEFEEAWLDEGFNQYFEGRVMDETYGPKTSATNWFGYRSGDMETSRDGYVRMDNPAASPAFGPVWQLPDQYYGVLTYFKTATWLRTLEGLLGRPVMDEVMRTYFQRWQFKHPSGQNFIDIVNEIVPQRLGQKYGPDMNWFFQQVLYGDAVCDYKLTSIREQRGKTVVRVDRLGDARFPVDVLVRIKGKDGAEKDLLLPWDGKARFRQLTVPLANGEDVLWAHVDPKQKIYMDVNLNNNSLALRPATAPAGKYAVKFLFWVQNAMQWLAWLA